MNPKGSRAGKVFEPFSLSSRSPTPSRSARQTGHPMVAAAWWEHAAKSRCTRTGSPAPAVSPCSERACNLLSNSPHGAGMNPGGPVKAKAQDFQSRFESDPRP